MVLADGDFVAVKAYKPPQQHVVSYKKRSDEAWAEWAQHQFRYACVCVAGMRCVFWG